MQSESALRETLRRIDGRGYKAYKDIRGDYDLGGFVLHIDHVQGDPFASPSRLRVSVPMERAAFPSALYSTRSREVALRDLLTRRFAVACRRHAKGDRGLGHSGLIRIDRPGQEVLERTSAFVDDEIVEARFVAGLPAMGRRIAGRQAESMLLDEIPRIVEASLLQRSGDSAEAERHVATVEDADWLREQLGRMGLVAFVADGAILPRQSGVDPRPLPKSEAIPFESPPSLRVEVDLPNGGRVTGMGIPKGVTLIVGGGYHGKSTLLDALELGVYDHILGDGRERVVSDPRAAKIRAEDGRRIENVDISPFISNLPMGRPTREFCSEDASGSTSQAANIIEALEAGASALFIDEDTSATNFMIRDHRMQELVAKDNEPITPFVDKVRQLYAELSVSTIIVIGGSGDYFEAADHVICMVGYAPVDVTNEAREIADRYRSERRREGGERIGTLTPRVPLAKSLDASKGKHDAKIKSRGVDEIVFGRHSIELGSVEQIVDGSQTRAIGDAILLARSLMDGRRTLREIIEEVAEVLADEGLDALSRFPRGDYAEIRPLELAAAINRLRTLSVKH